MPTHYICLVQYRSKPDVHLAEWCSNICETLSGFLRLPRAGLSAGGSIGESAAEWPDKKYHRYDSRVMSIDRILRSFMNVPDSATSCSVHANRHGSTDKLRDFSWYVSCHRPDPRSSDKFYDRSDTDLLDWPTTFCVAVTLLNASLFGSSELKSTHLALRSLLESAVKYVDNFYSFVAIYEADDNSVGWLYGPHVLEPYEPSLLREEVSWRRLVNEKSKIRGVFWGNLWGSEVTNKLSKAELWPAIQRLIALENETASLGEMTLEHVDKSHVCLYLTDNIMDSHPDSLYYKLYVSRRNKVLEFFRTENFIVV